jgi:hypothetical protein
VEKLLVDVLEARFQSQSKEKERNEGRTPSTKEGAKK